MDRIATKERGVISHTWHSIGFTPEFARDRIVDDTWCHSSGSDLIVVENGNGDEMMGRCGLVRGW